MTRSERSTASLGLALAAALGLSGCSGVSGSSPQPHQEEPRLESYVALGDSFTAAPLVPTTALAGGCLRSSGNFPSLLADELDTELRDVSCSGADTSDITEPQSIAGGQGSVPPQLRAVEEDTDLVTVGIGGNDSGLFATLTRLCTGVGPPDSRCEDRLRAELGDAAPYLKAIGRSVASKLRLVRRAAPAATVVLVGYPRLTDPERPCRAFPLAPGSARFLAGIEERLNRALRAAARAAGTEFVDMHPVSTGHEICSADPWVNGKSTDQSRAIAYHPFAEGQQAVADEVAALLRR